MGAAEKRRIKHKFPVGSALEFSEIATAEGRSPQHSPAAEFCMGAVGKYCDHFIDNVYKENKWPPHS